MSIDKKINWLYIDNSQGASGNFDLAEEDFFSLQVGAKVIQIGDGRENGSIRTDRFTQPFTYSGAFKWEGVKYYAFRVPENMLPENSEPHYLLYESTGIEILRRTKSYNRFIVPEFTIGDQNDINMRNVFMDGDFNDSYESKIKKSNGKN